MDLTLLWTGDKLRIISSNTEGKFEGIHSDGKARVLVDDKILLISNDNLELLPEEEHFPDIMEFLKHDSIKTIKNSKPIAIKFDHTIDLHIEKLAPHLENELPARILDYQLEQSEAFLRHAIEKGYPHITIIHGKGQGILKSAIEHQLSLFHQVKITYTKNGGGAVEVWL